MPFNKEAKLAEDILREDFGERLEAYDGQTLQLNEIVIIPSQKFGNGTTLICQTEDGTTVKITTFSQVVADQVDKLKGQLPCLITPRNQGDYYTLV